MMRKVPGAMTGPALSGSPARLDKAGAGKDQHCLSEAGHIRFSTRTYR